MPADKVLIRVGHSPDPDDAFMFHALANDKIPTGDLTFAHELQDIETLNRRAMKGELEVSAVSIHAYSHLLEKYALLPTGCSMGDRYGPMVVARRPMAVEELTSVRVAVPGTLTTAFLMAQNGPPRKSLAGSKDIWQKAKVPDPAVLVEIVQAREKGTRNPPKISTWAQMTTALREEMSLVWAGKTPLADGVKNVSAKWDDFLKDAVVDTDAN